MRPSTTLQRRRCETEFVSCSGSACNVENFECSDLTPLQEGFTYAIHGGFCNDESWQQRERASADGMEKHHGITDTSSC